MAAIAAPMLDYLIPIASSDYINRENRNYAAFPEIRLAQIDSFPGQFDDYFNDNFHFRGELLDLNNFIKLNLYKESPHPSVIMGKKGWLFIQKYLNSYSSEVTFSSQELIDFRNLYTERTQWLKNRGIRNYIFIIPSKFNVYPEYLPNSVYKKSLVSKKEQFIEATRSIDNLKVIDLEPFLLDEKTKSPTHLYYKTDQHWNEYGAFIAYSKIIEVLHNDFPEVSLVDIDDFVADSIAIPGKSLARIISIEKRISEMDIKVKAKNQKSISVVTENSYTPPIKFPYKNAFHLEYTTANDSLPKILVLRDSYAVFLRHLLPESFSKTILIWDNWCYRLNEEIVTKEEPDIYITLIIESNLDFILYKHPSERE